jgi:hypothetical protein
MREKLKNHLFIPVLMLMAIFMLSSHVSKDVTNESGSMTLLTIKSVDGTVQTFDLLIKGKRVYQEDFFMREKSMSTPYELEIEEGTYSIIIHRTSADGVIIGKVQKLVDGEVKGSASSDDEVAFLTIDDPHSLGATGI